MIWINQYNHNWKNKYQCWVKNVEFDTVRPLQVMLLSA